MSSLRRRPRQPRLFATERPPRLVLRFAVVLSLALGLAAALILVVVRHFALQEAERSATRHANLVASTLLQREIRPTDLARPVSPNRRRELDALFRPFLVSDGALGVSLIRRDGLVTYSTSPREIRERLSPGLVREAAEGTIVSRAAEEGARGPDASQKVLETFAPVGSASAGAARVVQPYAPIHQAAQAAQLRVGAVLQVLLLVLFVVFVPLLARVTTRIRRQIETIHAQAFYDPLTGLPNRAHLVERLDVVLARAGDAERGIAVLLLDLDRFREINDTLGHEAGDRLLEELAARLAVAADEGDMLLARIGGDEFAIVAECADERNAATLAAKVRAVLEPPTVVDGLPLAVEGTIGMALFPDHGSDSKTLLKHAEIATYTAKEWRAAFVVYDPADDPHDPEQLELVAALRDAGERGELRLHYQPKIDLATGRTTGVEALTYWEHPTRGLLAPGAFISIAERTGAIRHVTHAVLASALRQLAEWDALGAELTVSVNVAAGDVLDPSFPGRLEALLSESRVAPSRLCLELTERTVVSAPDLAGSILKRIVASGVQLSIDDFGTGHASLAHLRNLPVHEVKIDRSFVTDLLDSPSDRTIVTAAIQLGHSLGLRMVAEGVETSAVHDTLRELGCDQAQGYLYGRPQPAEATTALLSESALEAA